MRLRNTKYAVIEVFRSPPPPGYPRSGSGRVRERGKNPISSLHIAGSFVDEVCTEGQGEGEEIPFLPHLSLVAFLCASVVKAFFHHPLAIAR